MFSLKSQVIAHDMNLKDNSQLSCSVKLCPSFFFYFNNSLKSKVLNFNVYRPIWAVHTGSRWYQYADHPLSGSTNVFTGIEVYQSVHTGMVDENIFKILGCTIGMP